MADYKRRIYLINPSFQLRFSFYVCLMVFLASLIYPWTIYEVFGKIITQLSSNSPEIAKELSSYRGYLISVLAAFQLGITGLIFVICIFFSHRIAGPLYKLRRYFSYIREGNGFEKLHFRKGDYFPEIAEDYNETFGELQENHRKDFVYLSEVSAYLNNLALVVPEDKKVILTEIKEKLAYIQTRFDKGGDE